MSHLNNKQQRTKRQREELRKKYEFAQLKYYDLESVGDTVPTNSLSATTNPFTTSVCGPGQGSAANQVIGRMFLYDHVTIRGAFTYTPPEQATTAVYSEPAIVRIIVYLDFNAGGSQQQLGGATTSLLDTPTDSSLSVYALQNLENSHRYRVLRDYTYQLTPSAGLGTAGSQVWSIAVKHFHYEIDLAKMCLEAQTAAASSSSTTPMTIALRLGYVANLSNVTADLKTRTRFYSM